MNLSRNVTIYDIARAANVAPSTVSRAFTRPKRVNQKTVDRVLAVAAELGYMPNRSARTLSTGLTGNLGMVAPNIANPFFAEFLRSFQHRASEYDYSVIFIDTHEDADLELSSVVALASQTDGVVLCSPRIDDDTLADLATEERVVVVNRAIGGAPGVMIDSSGALTDAFDQLIALGHKRIVYARGPVHGVSDQLRRTTAAAVAERHGLELRISEPMATDKDTARAVLDLVSEIGATAVLAHSDLAAICLLSECQDRGVRVPVDLSVIGHDNIDFASMLHPTLSTIDAKVSSVAHLAADRLVALVEENGADNAAPSMPAASIVTSTYLARASVGPAPA